MRVILSILFCLMYALSVAQQSSNEGLNKSVHYQVGVGIATTNFSYPEPGYSNKPLFFVHSNVFLLKNITQRLDGRIGIAFEPVGYTTTVDLGNNQSYYNKIRLYYSNIQAMTGYRLNRAVKRIDIRLLTGVFVGRLLEQDIVSLLKPDDQIFKSRAVSTYRLWNGGISVGLSGSMTVKKNKAVGLKLSITPGLTNIFLPEATQVTGIKRFTRSIDLSTFFNF